MVKIGLELRRIFALTFFLFFVLLPFWLWLFWLMRPTKSLDILILDKTVATTQYSEHTSLVWILRQYKYLNNKGELYDPKRDYLGFFPLPQKKFEIRDLSLATNDDLKRISNQYQALYCSDTYGVYYNDFYDKPMFEDYSPKIYGGLHINDFKLMRIMSEQQKLVVCEYNTIANPTPRRVRDSVENYFGFNWTGWNGRYFFSLDTVVNRDIPYWAIRAYKKQYNKDWTFKNAGIIIVNEDERIVILDAKTDLDYEVPSLITTDYGQEKFGVVAKVRYPYWFDISTTTQSNTEVSKFVIHTNVRGDSVLNHFDIPSSFSAVLERKSDKLFYYFAGDFSDNPINIELSKYSGIYYLSSLLYSSKDKSDRLKFFWKFYKPMVTQILSDYEEKCAEKDAKQW